MRVTEGSIIVCAFFWNAERKQLQYFDGKSKTRLILKDDENTDVRPAKDELWVCEVVSVLGGGHIAFVTPLEEIDISSVVIIAGRHPDTGERQFEGFEIVGNSEIHLIVDKENAEETLVPFSKSQLKKHKFVCRATKVISMTPRRGQVAGFLIRVLVEVEDIDHGRRENPRKSEWLKNQLAPESGRVEVEMEEVA